MVGIAYRDSPCGVQGLESDIAKLSNAIASQEKRADNLSEACSRDLF